MKSCDHLSADEPDERELSVGCSVYDSVNKDIHTVVAERTFDANDDFGATGWERILTIHSANYGIYERWIPRHRNIKYPFIFNGVFICRGSDD